MRIGFMGLGKLGFPCALAIASRGFSVTGYDISPEPEKWYNGKFYPYKEYNIDHYLKMSRLSIVHDLHSLVKNSDIIFVAIQTPHAPKYEGIDKLPNDRRDFDYSFLEEGVARLCPLGFNLERFNITVTKNSHPDRAVRFFRRPIGVPPTEAVDPPLDGLAVLSQEPVRCPGRIAESKDLIRFRPRDPCTESVGRPKDPLENHERQEESQS